MVKFYKGSYDDFKVLQSQSKIDVDGFYLIDDSSMNKGLFIGSHILTSISDISFDNGNLIIHKFNEPDIVFSASGGIQPVQEKVRYEFESSTGGFQVTELINDSSRSYLVPIESSGITVLEHRLLFNVGSKQFEFDGSSDVIIDVDPESIGAVPSDSSSSHVHQISQIEDLEDQLESFRNSEFALRKDLSKIASRTFIYDGKLDAFKQDFANRFLADGYYQKGNSSQDIQLGVDKEDSNILHGVLSLGESQVPAQFMIHEGINSEAVGTFEIQEPGIYNIIYDSSVKTVTEIKSDDSGLIKVVGSIASCEHVGKTFDHGITMFEDGAFEEEIGQFSSYGLKLNTFDEFGFAIEGFDYSELDKYKVQEDGLYDLHVSSDFSIVKIEKSEMSGISLSLKNSNDGGLFKSIVNYPYMTVESQEGLKLYKATESGSIEEIAPEISASLEVEEI